MFFRTYVAARVSVNHGSCHQAGFFLYLSIPQAAVKPWVGSVTVLLAILRTPRDTDFFYSTAFCWLKVLYYYTVFVDEALKFGLLSVTNITVCYFEV